MVRRSILLMIAAAAVFGPLALAFEAAPKEVGLAVAIAALAALVGTYLWLAVTVVRAAKHVRPNEPADDQPEVERIRRRARIIIPMMIMTPVLVGAAHPWGLIPSLVVGWGAVMLCQFAFTQFTVVGHLVMERRKRIAARAQGQA